MRIISGTFRGKKILQPLDNLTRPLKDLTKESIFNVIKHSNKFNIDFEKSYILDLFSGVGSFGLECISRGARFVTFIEYYKEVISTRAFKDRLETIGNVRKTSITLCSGGIIGMGETLEDRAGMLKVLANMFTFCTRKR